MTGGTPTGNHLDTGSNTGAGTALVVEDNAETREWLCHCLRAALPDGRVIATESLRNALAAVQSESFSLALVDLGLPDGSGLDVIRAIRRSEKGRSTYIVVATISDDDKSVFTALKSGAQGYILKDQDRDRIVSYLRGIPLGNVPLSNQVARRLVEHFNGSVDALEEAALAPREQDVLRFIAKGFSVADAAGILGLQTSTVKGYVKSLYAKLGINSRAEATSEAIRLGLLDVS